MIGLRVHFPSREVRTLLREYRSQIPFATAKALTATASAMIPGLRESLTRHLDVRSRGLPKAAWNQRGSVVRAEKRDYPRLQAIVGIRNDERFQGAFLVDHIVGRTRRKDRGRFAIPTSKIKRGRRGKVAKPRTPRRILERPAGFLEGTGNEARIALKKGRGRVKRREILYHLRDSVRIKKQWPLGKDAKRLARRIYPGKFEDALRAAATSSIKRAQRRAAKRAAANP